MIVNLDNCINIRYRVSNVRVNGVRKSQRVFIWLVGRSTKSNQGMLNNVPFIQPNDSHLILYRRAP